MLYVFQVDIGRMMTFDMAFAMQTVGELKQHIEHEYKIPVDKQVLLINTGQEIRSHLPVSSYVAGTDVNPFFLFSKVLLESNVPPSPNIDLIHDYNLDMCSKLRESAELQASLDTVTKRTQLAQHFYDVDRALCKVCNQLVYEQKMQKDGWSAVNINLEYLERSIKHRFTCYEQLFTKYMVMRDASFSCLQNLQSDVKLLERIPALPTLVDDETSTADKTETNTTLSVYEWISQSGDFLNSLQERCTAGLTQINGDIFTLLSQHVAEVLRQVNTPEMRSVGGLRDRIVGLECLFNQASCMVAEQLSLAQSFVKNKTSATNLNEPSILPDLCASHLHHLQIMLKNHNQIRDIVRRITKAKSELCDNLHKRLQWIVYMQNRLQDVDTNLFSHFTKLLLLQDHLNVLRQVHETPKLYLTAVTEVVRRRQFSQAFLLWASELACQSLTIYNEELARRKEFTNHFDEHFLSTLFRGMNDVPPNFATQAPSTFDSTLPKISAEDLERLRNDLPELASLLTVPPLSQVFNYCLLRSSKDDIDKVSDTTKDVEAKLLQVVNDAGVASNFDQKLLKAIDGDSQPRKTIERGCESETDTEEFEKLGQITSQQSDVPETSIGIQISSNENTKFKEQLKSFLLIMCSTIHQVKSEMSQLKVDTLYVRQSTSKQFSDLQTAFNRLNSDISDEHKSLQQLTVDHELELSDMQKSVTLKDDEIKSLKDSVGRFETKIQKLFVENTALSQNVNSARDENLKLVEQYNLEIETIQKNHEKHTKDVMDKLKAEFRDEAENMRARFKLITMERSPSESSLEKIDSSETILLQMRDNFELEKETAIQEAVSKESEKWKALLEETLQKLHSEHILEKEQSEKNIVQKCSMAKDDEINLLKTQLKIATDKIKNDSELKQFLEVESQTDFDISELKAPVKCDPSASMYSSQVTLDVSTTSGKSHRKRETKNVQFCVDGCKTGDVVLVLWDKTYKNFTIFQESTPPIFFLHSDSFTALNLEICDSQPSRNHCFGEVIDKEFYHARKDVNRFNVAKGTRFFRVRVQPTTKIFTQMASITQSQSMVFPSSVDSARLDVLTMSLQSHTGQMDAPQEGCVLSSITATEIDDSSSTSEVVEKGKEVTENLDLLLQQTSPEDTTKMAERSRLCILM